MKSVSQHFPIRLIDPSRKKQHQYTLCFLPRNSPYWMPAFNFFFPFKATCYKILIKSNQNSSHLNLKTLKIFCFLSILVSNIKSIYSLGRPRMSLSHLRDQALVGQLKFSPAKGRPCPRQSLTCLLFVISDEPHSGLRLTSPALFPTANPAQKRLDVSLPQSYMCQLWEHLWIQSYYFLFPHHQMFGYIFFRNVLSFSCLFSSPVILFSLHYSALYPIDHCFPSVICLATIISELFISIKSNVSVKPDSWLHVLMKSYYTQKTVGLVLGHTPVNVEGRLTTEWKMK